MKIIFAYFILLWGQAGPWRIKNVPRENSCVIKLHVHQPKIAILKETPYLLFWAKEKILVIVFKFDFLQKKKSGKSYDSSRKWQLSRMRMNLPNGKSCW